MTKSRVEILPNGLTLVFVKTNKKYAKTASIFVRFGGFNKEGILDDKKFKVKDGTAHFIEHLLIEKSLYGNLIIEYGKNNTKTNGATSTLKTEYWFQSTTDFEENLIKLITAVNKPVFTQKDIDEIKDAIVQEKLEREDDKYYEYYSSVYECMFKELKAPNVLGNINDIRGMTYDYIKKVYDIFYEPSNQVLIVNGNINYNKIKKLVIDTYNKLKPKRLNTSIPKLKLTDEISCKNKIIKKDIPNEQARVVYKVNLSKYTPIERLRFDWYNGKFLRHAIRELDEEVVSKKISTNSIGCSTEYIGDYCLIKLSLQTNKSNEFASLLSKINNIIMSKEEFEITNKRNLINLIMREESCYGEVDPFIDNILYFDYYNMDTIELIESFDYDEFIRMMSDIDFDNYSIIKLKKAPK